MRSEATDWSALSREAKISSRTTLPSRSLKTCRAVLLGSRRRPAPCASKLSYARPASRLGIHGAKSSDKIGMVTTAAASAHPLVLYRPSARADDALRRLCLAARGRGGRVTVLALAVQERPSSRCCDTRSLLWNRICGDMAREDLARAARVVDRHPDVDFGVIVARGGRAAEALADEALARGADQIVLADARKSGLGALERRRLRRTSPVPVSG